MRAIWPTSSPPTRRRPTPRPSRRPSAPRRRAGRNTPSCPTYPARRGTPAGARGADRLRHAFAVDEGVVLDAEQPVTWSPAAKRGSLDSITRPTPTRASPRRADRRKVGARRRSSSRASRDRARGRGRDEHLPVATDGTGSSPIGVAALDRTVRARDQLPLAIREGAHRARRHRLGSDARWAARSVDVAAGSCAMIPASSHTWRPLSTSSAER